MAVDVECVRRILGDAVSQQVQPHFGDTEIANCDGFCRENEGLCMN